MFPAFSSQAHYDEYYYRFCRRNCQTLKKFRRKRTLKRIETALMIKKGQFSEEKILLYKQFMAFQDNFVHKLGVA